MMGGFGMGGFGIGMILAWLVPILLVVWAVKWFLDENSKRKTSTEDPLDVLRQRYARGELSKEEFEDARATLLRRT